MKGFEDYDYTKLEKEIKETTALEAIDKALASENILWFCMWSGVAAACIQAKYPEAAAELVQSMHPLLDMVDAKDTLQHIRLFVEANGE